MSGESKIEGKLIESKQIDYKTLYGSWAVSKGEMKKK